MSDSSTPDERRPWMSSGPSMYRHSAERLPMCPVTAHTKMYAGDLRQRSANQLRSMPRTGGLEEATERPVFGRGYAPERPGWQIGASDAHESKPTNGPSRP